MCPVLCWLHFERPHWEWAVCEARGLQPTGELSFCVARSVAGAGVHLNSQVLLCVSGCFKGGMVLSRCVSLQVAFPWTPLFVNPSFLFRDSGDKAIRSPCLVKPQNGRAAVTFLRRGKPRVGAHGRGSGVPRLVPVPAPLRWHRLCVCPRLPSSPSCSSGVAGG